MPMRSRSLAGVVLLGCLAGCGQTGPGPTAQDPERPRPTPIEAGDDGPAILARAVRAFGGVEKFKRWSTGIVKYRSRGGFIPVEGEEIQVEDTYQLPGHFCRVAYPVDRGPAVSV